MRGQWRDTEYCQLREACTEKVYSEKGGGGKKKRGEQGPLNLQKLEQKGEQYLGKENPTNQGEEKKKGTEAVYLG